MNAIDQYIVVYFVTNTVAGFAENDVASTILKLINVTYEEPSQYNRLKRFWSMILNVALILFTSTFHI